MFVWVKKSAAKDQVKLTPDELVVRHAFNMLKEVNENLSEIPPEVYDLVKAIAMHAVEKQIMTLQEQQFAMIVNKFINFQDHLSKFSACGESICMQVCQGVDELFDQNPRKTPAIVTKVNLLSTWKKKKVRTS